MRHAWSRRVLALGVTLGALGCASHPPPTALVGGLALPDVPTAPPGAAARRPIAPRSVEIGPASWYGEAHHGLPTASGEPFDMHDLTAAHPTLPLGTRVRVTNLANARSVVVRVNDRGPFIPGRILDLSYAAAQALAAVHAGLVRVRVVPLSRP